MDGIGVVGHVGRKGLRFALVDDLGAVMSSSTRRYGADHGSSVSGALSTFQRDLSLPQMPQRLCLAVAGLARGDAISITQTRWIVSRSGLQAMLGRAPLILNDFEAEAWALTGTDAPVLQQIGASSGLSMDKPGTRCVIGMTSGLGVSVITRDAAGGMHVLATEAGHGGFSPASSAMAELIAIAFRDKHPIVAEHLVSANGLLTIYNALASQQGGRKLDKPEDVTRLAGPDPLARRACQMLCEAFWTYAASLVLVYGAWDGVIVTGPLAAVLRTMLASDQMRTVFIGTGKYARQLAAVPRATIAAPDCELLGAAKALQARKAG